jgi:hypothetical protein
MTKKKKKKRKRHTLNPPYKIGRKKIISMGYIQEQMFWKRFDLVDNKLDGIHEGNMKDMLYASRTNGQWTEGRLSSSQATA